MRGEFVINQRKNQRRSDPSVACSGDGGERKFAFGGPARAEVKERGHERHGDEAKRDGRMKAPQSCGVEIDGGNLKQRGDGEQICLKVKLNALNASADDQ